MISLLGALLYCGPIYLYLGIVPGLVVARRRALAGEPPGTPELARWILVASAAVGGLALLRMGLLVPDPEVFADPGDAPPPVRIGHRVSLAWPWVVAAGGLAWLPVARRRSRAVRWTFLGIAAVIHLALQVLAACIAWLWKMGGGPWYAYPSALMAMLHQGAGLVFALVVLAVGWGWSVRHGDGTPWADGAVRRMLVVSVPLGLVVVFTGMYEMHGFRLAIGRPQGRVLPLLTAVELLASSAPLLLTLPLASLFPIASRTPFGSPGGRVALLGGMHALVQIVAATAWFAAHRSVFI